MNYEEFYTRIKTKIEPMTIALNKFELLCQTLWFCLVLSCLLLMKSALDVCSSDKGWPEIKVMSRNAEKMKKCQEANICVQDIVEHIQP